MPEKAENVGLEVKKGSKETFSDEDDRGEGVYTAYIRGYIKLRDGTWRDPTKFFTLLRNAKNRGYVEKTYIRQQELLHYLEDKNITVDAMQLIRTNRDIVGEAVWEKFQGMTAMPMQGT